MLGAKVYYGLRSEKEVAFKSHLEQRHENNSKQELALRLSSGPIRGHMDR